MIKVVYGDVRPLLGASAFAHFFEMQDSAAQHRIMEPKRKEYRAYRLMTHLVLDALYRKEFGAPIPELRVTDLGKPYIEGGPAFSISHDRGFVCIAMTKDFSELGVDIQTEPNPVTASRVRRRFLTPVPPYRKAEPEVEFQMAHAESDGVDFSPAHPFGTPSSFLCDYVRAEAIMKMTGGGFADFPRLRELCSACDTALLPLGNVAIGLANR